jgi:hypothetical protein
MSKLRTTIEATITSKKIPPFAYCRFMSRRNTCFRGSRGSWSWRTNNGGTKEIAFTTVGATTAGRGATSATLGESPTIRSKKVVEDPPILESFSCLLIKHVTREERNFEPELNPSSGPK